MAHRRPGGIPIKDSERKPLRRLPKRLTERKMRIALGLANGLNGKQAGMAAGYTGLSARVRASEARRDPRVQEIIAEGRRAFVETIAAGHMAVRRRLGLEPQARGKKGKKAKGDTITLKEALDFALSRHFVQVAGLLAPDTAPPPTAGALVDALLGAIPPENLRPLMVRAALVIGEPGSGP